MPSRVCCFCEQAPAAVYCSADAAYLCAECDLEVHQSSPIAARHLRTPLACVGSDQVVSSGCTAEQSVQNPSETSGKALSLQIKQEPEQPTVSEADPWPSKHSAATSEIAPDFDVFDLDGSSLLDLDFSSMGSQSFAPLDQFSGSSSDGVVPDMRVKVESSGCASSTALQLDSLKDRCNSWHSRPMQTVPQAGPAMLRSDVRPDCRPSHPQMQPQLPQSMPAGTHPGMATDAHYHAAIMHAQNLFHSCYGMNPGGGFLPAAVPVWGPFPLACDPVGTEDPPIAREARVLRYREKRKRRTFEKTIRYESRKAYAEVRPRIRGRFATQKELAQMRAEEAAGQVPQAVLAAENIVSLEDRPSNESSSDCVVPELAVAPAQQGRMAMSTANPAAFATGSVVT